MDPPLSPLCVRKQQVRYKTWRQRYESPETKPGLRNPSADRQVFASFYEVPRQPAVASEQPSSTSDQRSPQQNASCNDDAHRSRRDAENSAEYKNKNPSSNKNKVDEDETEPVYAKPVDELSLFQSGSQGISDKSPALNIIPDFDPFIKEQTIDSWINKVELCKEICSWSDRHTTFYAILKLTGSAKTWYQNLPIVIASWEDLKKKLIEAFPATQNYAELLWQMMNVRAETGDCLELYYHAKINLLHRCNISGKEAVDCLVHGVNDKIVRFTVQAAQLTEPHLVLKFFKSLK